MHFIHDMLQFFAVHFHHFFAGVQHHLHQFDGTSGGPGKPTVSPFDCTDPTTCDGTSGGPGHP